MGWVHNGSGPTKRLETEESAGRGRGGERWINVRGVLEVETRDLLMYWMSAVREREK